MSRQILLSFTLPIVLFAGWVALRSWGQQAACASETRTPVLTTSQAFARYQQCQPHHWRALMLQR